MTHNNSMPEDNKTKTADYQRSLIISGAIVMQTFNLEHSRMHTLFFIQLD